LNKSFTIRTCARAQMFTDHGVGEGPTGQQNWSHTKIT
jgi:hypothetical protein